MSEFMNRTEQADTGDDDLKQSLRSLKPRSSIDPQVLLREVVARTDESPTTLPAVAATSLAPRGRASAWWPMLTALSWLMTAIVWWSSHSDSGAAIDGQSIGITTATHQGAPGDELRNATSAGPLGESIAAREPVTAEDATISVSDASIGSESSPAWLAWLGLEFAAFDGDAGERRWEQMQEQSESTHWPAASGAYSGDHASATYASLRREFGNPIRANWFSH